MKIPYSPDDDAAADRFINQQLRRPDARAWTALASDGYILQTDRILAGAYETITVSFAHRNGTLDVAKARLKAGEITDAEYAAILADYNDWKGRTAHFQSLVNQRRRVLADRVRRLRSDDLVESLRSTLLTLATAVAEHRSRVKDEYEPTPADTALWARVALLRYPCSNANDTITLAEAVTDERAKQRNERKAS